MRGSQKSKRVTWPSDVKLCQVKRFNSGESPSKVGGGSQNQTDDSLVPPGFEVNRVKLSHISLIKWRCPLPIEVKNEWQVVASKESNELEAQNQRERREFEAIYPRTFNIPPNPCVSPVVENSSTDDQNTPIFSTISTEDCEAAAQDALASLIKLDQDGVLDRNLLIKLLTDPNMVDQLTKHRLSSSLQNEPSSSSSSQGTPAQTVTSSIVQHMPSSSSHRMPDVGAQTVASSIIQHHIPLNGTRQLNMLSTSTQHMPNSQKNQPSLSSQRTHVVGPQTVTSSIAHHMPINGARQNMPSSSSHSMPVVGAQTCTSSIMYHTPVYGTRQSNMLSSSSQSMPVFGAQTVMPSVVHHMPAQNLNQNIPATSTQHMPNLSQQNQSSSRFHSTRVAGPQTVTSTSTNIRPSRNNPLPAQMSLFPSQIRAGTGPSLQADVMPNQMIKDINYYKNLIQQHGGGKQDHFAAHGSQETVNFIKSRDKKRKVMKPCVYFNSIKGCRNGSSCIYLHEYDMSLQQRVSSIPEVQAAKRMKLDRAIIG